MAELPKMFERRDTGEPMHACTYLQIRVLIRLVAAATIQERRLFCSALAQVRLLFKSGVYSREASIQSYTVVGEIEMGIERTCHLVPGSDVPEIPDAHISSARSCVKIVPWLFI